MERANAERRLSGVVAEFVLIVVGVMVALAADDMRQRFERRESADAARLLLVADLERDSVALQEVLDLGPGSNSGTAWILGNARRLDFPDDSLQEAIHTLLVAPDYNAIRATFDLLLQQDGLRSLGDPAFQAEIVRYYEELQEDVLAWRALFWEAYINFTLQFSRITAPSSSSPEAVLNDHWYEMETNLTVSWDDVRSDNVLMNSVYIRHITGQLYEQRARRALDANAALLARLREGR